MKSSNAKRGSAVALQTTPPFHSVALLSPFPPLRSLPTSTYSQVQISENAVLKVDEIQRPIIGGSWTTKTDFGRLEIKIVPYWTGE